MVVSITRVHFPTELPSKNWHFFLNGRHNICPISTCKIFSFLFNRFPTVAMMCQCYGNQFFPAGIIIIGKGRNLFFPDLCQQFVICFKFVASHYSATFMSIDVIDHHPVAAEFPADSRAGRVDCTGESFPRRVFPHERAAFYRFPLF
jgi:hypothetical protein